MAQDDICRLWIDLDLSETFGHFGTIGHQQATLYGKLLQHGPEGATFAHEEYPLFK